jgi:hypothetical protein
VNETIAFFGGTAPPEIDWRLRDEAYALDPECLPVYFARYKFFFYKSRLADAEQVARQALETAALQAGFPTDWNVLEPDSADWADFRGPAHFYLFSLKALAFIRLRRGAARASRRKRFSPSSPCSTRATRSVRR